MGKKEKEQNAGGKRGQRIRDKSQETRWPEILIWKRDRILLP